MKKTVLFYCLVFTLLTSNNFAATQFKKQDLILKERLDRFSQADPYKKATAKEELKKYLARNYSNISDVQEKTSISGLLKEFKNLNSQNSPDNIEKLTIKNTILNSVRNLTSPSAIACATIIVVLFQIKGIVTSEELIAVLQNINSTIKWHFWGNIVGVIANLVPPFLLKILGKST